MPESIQKISFDNYEVSFAYKTDKELKKAAWLYSLINNPLLTQIGTRLTPVAFKLRLPLKALVKSTIFEQFCGGETLEECIPATLRLARFHVDTILDYGVEAKEDKEDFDKTTSELLKAIAFAEKNQHVTFVSIKITGIARFALLEKLNAKQELTDAEILEWNLVKGRLHRVCKAAHTASIGVMIDAEETWIQDPIDELAVEMMRFYNKERPIVYNTIQLYRADRFAFLESSLDEAANHDFILAVKLVRGAYMEKERKRATKMGYRSPIQPDKEATDRDYNKAVQFCIDQIDRTSFCIASHNEYSNKLGAELAERKGLPPSHPHLHFSQLYGMSDNITFNLAHAGFKVSKYVPYGPVKDVVPYLMRRARENTSVAGQSSRELLLLRKEMKRRRL